MSAHRDFVKDDLTNRQQVRIGRLYGDESVLGWEGLEAFDGRTVFITDAHDMDQCLFADGDTVPLIVSSRSMVVPDVAVGGVEGNPT